MHERFKTTTPNIRIVGLRAARQIGADLFQVVSKLVRDPSAAVRRECAIAIRHLKHPSMPDLWAELAMQHDGKDRWYLEALGIGAALKWDDCMSAWVNRVKDDWNSATGRDIVWRSRAKTTAAMLGGLIKDANTPTSELPRLFRALDYQQPSEKQSVVLELAFSTVSTNPERSSLISAESIQRIGNLDLSKNKKHAAALNRIIDQSRGDGNVRPTSRPL